MKVGFLVVVVALVATSAPPLSSRAETQKQKRGARSVPRPTPAPSAVSANSTKTSNSSSGEEAEPWEKRRIRSISDARRFFEAMDGSPYHMMRDHPDRWGEYWELKIDDAQEDQWRREMLTKLSDQLLNPATDAKELWWLHSRMERICTDVDDAESVLKIYEVTRRIAGRLPLEDGIIVAETINGHGYHSFQTGLTVYTNKTGLIYLAMKHGLRDVAQDLAGYSMSLAQRAKSGKVDVERAEMAIERCLAVKRHFRLR
jgi:hypothetical protein